jgi:hypothetical protein
MKQKCVAPYYVQTIEEYLFSCKGQYCKDKRKDGSCVCALERTYRGEFCSVKCGRRIQSDLCNECKIRFECFTSWAN